MQPDGRPLPGARLAQAALGTARRFARGRTRACARMPGAGRAARRAPRRDLLHRAARSLRETDLINTVAEAVQLVDEIGSPALQTMIDCSAAGQAESASVPELIDALVPTASSPTCSSTTRTAAAPARARWRSRRSCAHLRAVGLRRRARGRALRLRSRWPGLRGARDRLPARPAGGAAWRGSALRDPRDRAATSGRCKLRLPFRFGVVTLTECPQAFARARIELADGRSAWGGAAELMAPKWFDKNLALSNDDNFEQLRDVLRLARAAYLADATRRHRVRPLRPPPRRAPGGQAPRAAYNPLLASYGPALIDRALLDALCRALGVSFYAAMRDNLVGLGARHAPSSRASTWDGFLRTLAPSATIEARHTVGPGRCDHRRRPAAAGRRRPARDARAGGGRATATAISSSRSAAASSRRRRAPRPPSPPCSTAATQPYFVSLDGNEQYEDAAGVAELLARLRADAGAGAAAELDPVHRAADRAQERARRRRARRSPRDQAGDHRRVRRRARRLRARARARLHRHLEQDLQGPVQVAAQRRALRRVERRGAAARATSCRART